MSAVDGAGGGGGASMLKRAAMLFILEDLERRKGDRLCDDWPLPADGGGALEDENGDLDLDVAVLFTPPFRVGVRNRLDDMGGGYARGVS